MTTFSRLVAALLGLAVAASAWLPWTRAADAWHLHLRSLLSPGTTTAVSWSTSIGLALSVAACGISMGGQGALKLAYRRPQDFPIVAALTPAVPPSVL